MRSIKIFFAIFGALVFFFILINVFLNKNPENQTQVANTTVEWSTYNALNDGFSVLLPGTPAFTAIDDKTEKGIPFQFHSYSAKYQNQLYAVVKLVFSQPTQETNPDLFLEKILNGLMRSGGDEIITAEYGYDKSSFRTLDFFAKDPDKNAYLKGRVVLIGDTPYILITSYLANAIPDTHYEQFVNSIEVK